jgi:hypothetical protein
MANRFLDPMHLIYYMECFHAKLSLVNLVVSGLFTVYACKYMSGVRMGETWLCVESSVDT